MINKGTIVLGLITASAVGAALGVLFAPDKGSKTRKRVVDEAMIVKDELKTETASLRNDLSESVKAGKEKFNEEFGVVVKKASHKADDIIDVIEKGLDVLRTQNKKLQETS